MAPPKSFVQLIAIFLGRLLKGIYMFSLVCLVNAKGSTKISVLI